MVKNTAGNWFKSKKGNTCRYWYKEGHKYGIEIKGKGMKYLSTGKFKSFKSMRKNEVIRTRNEYRRKKKYKTHKKGMEAGYIDHMNEMEYGK